MTARMTNVSKAARMRRDMNFLHRWVLRSDGQWSTKTYDFFAALRDAGRGIAGIHYQFGLGHHVGIVYGAMAGDDHDAVIASSSSSESGSDSSHNSSR